MATTIRLNGWWKHARWFRIIGTVLNIELSIYMNVIHMLPQDVEDACRIAKHLKMGVKEKDGEIYLEEAADWFAELYNKIWLEEDLHKILKAIGLEDLEAWKKKYNIIAHNKHLKLEMLLTINNMHESDIQEYILPEKSGLPTPPEEVDEIIKLIIIGYFFMITTHRHGRCRSW
jgi:hypothetical protein